MADANEELRRMLREVYEALYGPQGVPFSHTVADAVDAVDDAAHGAVDTAGHAVGAAIHEVHRDA